MHVEEYPSSVAFVLGAPVQVVDLALVKALIGLSHLGQIERRLANARNAILIALRNVRRIAGVPNVNGQLVRILQPVHDERFLEAVFELDGAVEDHVLADERADFVVALDPVELLCRARPVLLLVLLPVGAMGFVVLRLASFNVVQCQPLAELFNGVPRATCRDCRRV